MLRGKTWDAKGAQAYRHSNEVQCKIRAQRAGIMQKHLVPGRGKWLYLLDNCPLNLDRPRTNLETFKLKLILLSFIPVLKVSLALYQGLFLDRRPSWNAANAQTAFDSPMEESKHTHWQYESIQVSHYLLSISQTRESYLPLQTGYPNKIRYFNKNHT